jgi:hypothetical protein
MRHLSQRDLGQRWHVSPRTLENMRWQKRGPAYLKVGGRVLYRLEDIEIYEQNNIHAGGSSSGALVGRSRTDVAAGKS